MQLGGRAQVHHLSVPSLDATHRAPPAASDALRQAIEQPLAHLSRREAFLLELAAQRLRDSLAFAQRAEALPEAAESLALLAAGRARAAREQHVERRVESPDRHARVVDRHRIAVAKLLGGLLELLELAASVVLDRRLRRHTGSADSRGFAWSASSNRVTR